MLPHAAAADVQPRSHGRAPGSRSESGRPPANHVNPEASAAILRERRVQDPIRLAPGGGIAVLSEPRCAQSQTHRRPPEHHPAHGSLQLQNAVVPRRVFGPGAAREARPHVAAPRFGAELGGEPPLGPGPVLPARREDHIPAAGGRLGQNASAAIRCQALGRNAPAPDSSQNRDRPKPCSFFRSAESGGKAGPIPCDPNPQGQEPLSILGSDSGEGPDGSRSSEDDGPAIHGARGGAEGGIGRQAPRSRRRHAPACPLDADRLGEERRGPRDAHAPARREQRSPAVRKARSDALAVGQKSQLGPGSGPLSRKGNPPDRQTSPCQPASDEDARAAGGLLLQESFRNLGVLFRSRKPLQGIRGAIRVRERLDWRCRERLDWRRHDP